MLSTDTRNANWDQEIHATSQRAEMVRTLSGAQARLDAAWGRLHTHQSADSADDPDFGAVLDYEMALNDLLEVKRKAEVAAG